MCFDIFHESGKVYQLSQRMMTWSLLWNSGITCRIMETASSSLDSFSATYDNQEERKDKKLYPCSRQVCRAWHSQSSVHSDSWNRCVRHGQTVLKHFQFCAKFRYHRIIHTQKYRLRLQWIRYQLQSNPDSSIHKSGIINLCIGTCIIKYIQWFLRYSG